MAIAYQTPFGTFHSGKAETILCAPEFVAYKKKVDLIFTSPPFPLNRKKKYGNLQGQEYIDWLAGFAPLFNEFLKPKGSIVIEVGNSWEPGRPVMSTLALEALLAFQKREAFSLCQQFVYYNPAKLPGPAEWVTIERIRVKDSYTHLWWMSKTDRPEANNRRVLKEYSEAMKTLLSTKKYDAGKRPSEHNINETSFLRNNKGAIPSNVLTLTNTQATSNYLRYCRTHKLTPHPARMPIGVPEFFIKFLTKANGLILDPFAGSNTTGAAAEALKRKWLAIELDDNYIKGSQGRFKV
jgi:DNA modification methylase